MDISESQNSSDPKDDLIQIFILYISTQNPKVKVGFPKSTLTGGNFKPLIILPDSRPMFYCRNTYTNNSG